MATCLINGKRYVGVTSGSLYDRSRAHIRASASSKKTTKLINAIRKHGSDMFRFRCIKTCSSYDEALAEERRLIAVLKPDYNMTMGGEGFLGMAGPFKGLHRPKEVMERVWATKRKTGSYKSERVKAGARVANAVVAKLRRRAVLCHDDGLIYESVAKASAFYKTNAASISQVCRGLNGTANGRSFSYIEQDSLVNRPRPRGRAVLCVNDGLLFDTAVAAAMKYNVKASLISHVCRGVRRDTKGFVFRYAD